MDKRIEFERLLYGTTVDSLSSQETAKVKIKTLQEWIITNIPDRLYRFRANTEYAVSALRNDEIWGSNLWEFNDPYECIPFYNLDTIQSELERELSFEHILNLIQLFKSGNIPAAMTNAFGAEMVERIIANIPDRLDESALRTNCEIMKQQIIAFIVQNFNDLCDQFFTGILQAESQRHIACFSEHNDSSLMWGHYANGHHGFCLEYDFKSILKPCQQGCTDIKGCNNFMITPSIAPVIYSKSRFDATSHLLTVIQANIIARAEAPMELYYGDTLLISKCLLTKSLDWEYEKEWRLFSPPSIDSVTNHKVIFSLKPTAVYIGRRSSAEQAQILNEICKEKDIPCYQMIQNYHGDDFKLFPVSYAEYMKGTSPRK
ncbi:DUF2971 domain-containing protein [Acutalibacter sp. LFL-21]|uniref:DUF2971 domain-containing protein n=1 Tax=Acutalibacter sp. LFL-21 TaxID=2983399 RepID=UPI0021D68156|nr:DUF2971 domain-containing protein [Acutalibacter sp. LFL-21]MCU7653721.1 DUF2971 domain-containing protein [Acutalibacter sp. LFL-21]